MAVVRFGVFEIDESTGEVRRQGRRVHIAAQPLSALLFLASRPRAIVSRDELRRHLWGESTFVEFDRSLNFCIAEIRAALGDDARNPRFVETIPRRGYRFIADVHRAESSQPTLDQPRDETLVRTISTWKWLRAWSWAAVVPLLLMQQPLRLAAHTRTTAAPEAVAAFERALKHSEEDAEGQRRGIAALRMATRIDPRFAEAHYALADMYLGLVMRRELPIEAALGEARAAAERAVALEEAAETRQVLGTIDLLDGNKTGARREFARALALEPKWDFAQVAYARLLSAEGDDRGATAAIDRAETLSPNCDLILFDAGQIYARARRLDEALTRYRGAIQFGPPRRTPETEWRKTVEFRILVVNVVRGDWVAAHQSAAAIVAASGASDEVQARFGAHDPRDAVTTFLRRSADDLTSRRVRDRVSPTMVATLHALVGEADAALDWLERAARERDPELVYALRDPEFDSLRELPRFRALVAATFRA